jgi:hypothetical protein
MLIATPDEILQKGLEMGGFNHRQQQSPVQSGRWLKRRKIKRIKQLLNSY